MSRLCRECSTDITGTHFNRRFCEVCSTPQAKNRRTVERNPDYFYNHSLQRFYGITRETYDSMCETQSGLCAICGDSPRGAGNGGRLVVDHCHKTGAVRALLCSPCNKGIGHLRDDPEVIAKAVKYLKEFCE